MEDPAADLSLRNARIGSHHTRSTSPGSLRDFQQRPRERERERVVRRQRVKNYCEFLKFIKI